MFDHIGFSVSNYAASKTFFLKSLEVFGVSIVMEGEHGLGLGQWGSLRFGCSKRPRSLRTFIWHSPPKVANKSKSSIAPHSKLAAKTMVHPVFVRSTTRTTMGRSLSVPMVTTSRRFVIAPRPNPSIEGTSTIRLRLLAAAPHVKR